MGSTKLCFTAAELAVSLFIYMYAYNDIHTRTQVAMPKFDTCFLLLHITKDMSLRRGMCYAYLKSYMCL